MTADKNELSPKVDAAIDEIQRELEDEISPRVNAAINEIEAEELKAEDELKKDVLEVLTLMEELDTDLIEFNELIFEAKYGLEDEYLDEQLTLSEQQEEQLEISALELIFDDLKSQVTEMFQFDDLEDPEALSVQQEEQLEIPGLDMLFDDLKSQVTEMFQFDDLKDPLAQQEERLTDFGGSNSQRVEDEYDLGDTVEIGKYKPMGEKRAGIAGELDTLIANFDKSDVIRLYQNCDILVEKYGFTAFQNAFDEILADKDLLAQSRKSSLRELNRYLSDSMTATMKSLLLQGAQKQAREVLDLFHKPSANHINDAKQLLQNSSAAEAKNLIEQAQNSKIEAIIVAGGTEESKEQAIEQAQQEGSGRIAAIDLLVKARELAEEDDYQEVQELARAGLRKETELAIAALENSKVTEEDKAAAVHILEFDLDSRLTAVANRDMPIDYYIEKARFENLTAKKIGAMTQLSSDMTNKMQAYIRQNLLSATSLDKRTVIMERNILMMEKCVQEGDLLTAHTIFLALQETSVSRLGLTQAGLSSHAQRVVADLKEDIFSLEKNSANWRRYIAENESASLPPFLISKDLQIWPEQPFKNLINVGEHGELTTTLAQNCFKEISSCEKALAAGEALRVRSNPVLVAEMQPVSMYEQLHTSKDYTLELMPENGELKEGVLYISFDENKPENIKYTVKSANGELKEREISMAADLFMKYDPNQLLISQLQAKAKNIMEFAEENKDIPPVSLENYFFALSKQIESQEQQNTLEPSSRVEKIREIIRPRPTVKEYLETSLEKIEDRIEKIQLQTTKIQMKVEQYRENHPSLWSKIRHKISSFFNSFRLDSVVEHIQKGVLSVLMEKNLRSRAISEETVLPAETRESKPKEENSRISMMKRLFAEALNPSGNSGSIPPQLTAKFKEQLPREEKSEDNTDTNVPRNL